MNSNITSVLGNQGENGASCDPARTIDALPTAGPWRGDSENFYVRQCGMSQKGQLDQQMEILLRCRNKMMDLRRLRKETVRAAAVRTKH